MLALMADHPFDRCGLAALSDLAGGGWQELYGELRDVQREFLSKESQFRSPDYPWPRDALHNWSRIWEYPYVHHHLLRESRRPGGPSPVRVADVGSGVTFYPFALARRGFHVTCFDNDVRCVRDLDKAVPVVPHGPGKVTAAISGDKLPAPDGSMDVVYCISVLEHVPHFERLLGEMHRLLAPSGLLVLTVDIDLRGDKEINVEQRRALWTAVREGFELAVPEQTIHPRDMLTSMNGPHAFAAPSELTQLKTRATNLVLKRIGRPEVPVVPIFQLTVEGIVARKR